MKEPQIVCPITADFPQREFWPGTMDLELVSKLGTRKQMLIGERLTGPGISDLRREDAGAGGDSVPIEAANTGYSSVIQFNVK